MSDQAQDSGLLAGGETAAVAPLPPQPKAAAKGKAKAKVDAKASTVAVVGTDEDGYEVNAFGERMFTIILEESDGIPPTGQFVGINGRSYVIRPGEEVTVPESVLEVLNDAVASVPRTDGNGNVVDYRDKQRLPYRLIMKKK